MQSKHEQYLKNEIFSLNLLGKNIIDMSKVMDTLDEDAQTEYARQLLSLTQLYLRYVKEVQKLVNELRKEEKEENLPVSLKLKKLQKDLEKFNHPDLHR